MVKILAFAGSTRTGSVNGKLLDALVPLVEAEGAEVTRVDLREYEMPLYNGDIEAERGVPESARRLKALMIAHDGMLIASPEYNGSITPLLKNTLDWCSRKEEGDPGPLAAYADKTAAIVSISGGVFGGIRGLVPLRLLLSNLGMLVLPIQIAVGGAAEAFDEDGSLRNKGTETLARSMARSLVRYGRA